MFQDGQTLGDGVHNPQGDEDRAAREHVVQLHGTCGSRFIEFRNTQRYDCGDIWVLLHIVSPKKLETGLRTHSAGIPYI